jgi:hypothetical protein
VWIDLTKGQERLEEKNRDFHWENPWKSQNKFCECFAFSEIVVVLFGHLCHFLSFWKMEKIFKNDYHVAAQIQGTSAEKSWKAG